MSTTALANSRKASQRTQASHDLLNKSGPEDDGTLIYKDEKEGGYAHTSAGKASQCPSVPLLGCIETFVRRFVVLPEAAYTAVVLWIAHCWLVEAADVAPLLHLTSPTRQSGKTRLLEVLDLLVPNGWLTARTTTAALVRKLDKDKPVLLLDETDQVFKGNGEYTSALTAILNAGHRRGQKATISIKDGKDWGVADFEFFGPKALAGIESGLPDTVVDRAITISLVRQSNVKAERFRHREAKQDAEPLRAELQAVRQDRHIIEQLRKDRPELPEELSDRQQDIWEPLLSIADWFDWDKRARKAAVALSQRSTANDGDPRLALIYDLERLFKSRRVEWLPTNDILQHLLHDEERPWKTFNRGQELSAHQLGEMLRVFKIQSVRSRDNGNRLRGYRRDDINRVANIHNIRTGFMAAMRRE